MKYKDRVNIVLQQLKEKSKKHKLQSEDHRKHNGGSKAVNHWLYSEGIDYAIGKIEKIQKK